MRDLGSLQFRFAVLAKTCGVNLKMEVMLVWGRHGSVDQHPVFTPFLRIIMTTDSICYEPDMVGSQEFVLPAGSKTISSHLFTPPNPNSP